MIQHPAVPSLASPQIIEATVLPECPRLNCGRPITEDNQLRLVGKSICCQACANDSTKETL
jgi:hypothetical protein